MGLEVNIDLKKAMKFNIDNFEREAAEVVGEVAEMARGYWIQQAGENLRITSQDYIQGIQPTEFSDSGLEASIKLVGTLPNMIEQGNPAFDMKPGLLNSPKAHTSKKGGKYLAIPMEHGSPTQSKAQRLPDDVYQDAKKLKMGQKLSDQKHISTNIAGYKSKTGIYHGLERRTDPQVPGNIRNAFSTFRTVSSNSDSNSWWHPGFVAKLLAMKVKDYVESQLDAIVSRKFGS